jgi:hypothetical protein
MIIEADRAYMAYRMNVTSFAIESMKRKFSPGYGDLKYYCTLGRNELGAFFVEYYDNITDKHRVFIVNNHTNILINELYEFYIIGKLGKFNTRYHPIYISSTLDGEVKSETVVECNPKYIHIREKDFSLRRDLNIEIPLEFKLERTPNHDLTRTEFIAALIRLFPETYI